MFGARGSMRLFRMNRWGMLVSIVLVLSFVAVPRAYPLEEPSGKANRGLVLATDSNDQPWAAWEVADGHDVNVYYSRWNGSDWLAARPLSANPDVQEDAPSLAFADDGTTAWAAWTVSSGVERAGIVVSYWSDNGWSLPQQVPGTRVLRGDEPFLAAGPDGVLWLAWIGHDGTDREVYVSDWDGTTWSQPEQVGRDDTEPIAYDTHPRLAVGATGEVWLVWVSYEGSLDDQVHASQWDGTNWSAQQRVSTVDDLPDTWPSVALDADGRPWVAWQGAAAEAAGKSRIYVSHWNGTSSAWASEELASSPAGLAADERQPKLAFDDEGQLHLSWTVVGARTGIAHAVWDGTEPASPTWTPTRSLVDSQLVVVDGEPNLSWLAPQGVVPVPMELREVDELSAPLSGALPAQPVFPDRAAGVVPNRHLAQGDSITWGGYLDVDGTPATPYPTTLEQTLDSKVIQSEVINHGKPGEKARAAEARLREGMETYNPEFVEILEGTNDLSSDYSPADTAHHVRLLVQAIKADYSESKVMISTLTPRLDKRAGEVTETNQLLYTKVAQKERVPIADPWQAYHNYGDWASFYDDSLHPGPQGLNIIANTFYQKMVSIGWLPEDPNPPTARITSLPSQSGCFVPVNWDGDDGDGSGIASFDLQVRANGGAWVDWLNRTPQFYAFYVSPASQTLDVRVRARDNAGNVGDYSLPDTTKVVCNSTIERVYLPALSRQASH